MTSTPSATFAHDHIGAKPAVKPGVEVLFEDEQYLDLLSGKRVGLITNPTGVDSRVVSTIDLLHEHPDIELVALFGPEHGVRGDVFAGEKIADEVDPKTGVQIYSLYGKNRRPTPEMLEDVEVLVYDIQDVGSRSYTYIYTMAYGMEAASDADIPFVVLDRTQPAGAHIVDGNILDPEQYQSFIGLYAIAYQYGMTPGEAALMFNKEFNKVECDLTVVPCKGYQRDMSHAETGLPYVPASTHIARADAATFYNLTGIIGEIRNDISIGVGYTLPFEVMAAPWIDRDKFADALNAKNLPGIRFRPISFKPKYAGYKDVMCHGVQCHVTDFKTFLPVTTQLHMMEVINAMYPEKDLFSDEIAGRSAMDKVWGDDEVRERIRKGDKAEDIIESWQPKVDEFMKIRAKYLIYK